VGSPVIDLAPGAEAQPLARELFELVRSNVTRDSKKREAFERLRGAVAIVADDFGTALTLRFDFGRLVVHEGLIGVPDVTIRGSTKLLGSLGDLRSRTFPGLAAGILREGVTRATFDDAILEDAGELKIYGLVAHPVFVHRLLRVLSRG
jgi:hypothetical protein